MPDVIGDKVKQATRVLEAAGFKVKVVGPLATGVYDYSPIGEAAAGTTVTIDTVSF